MMRRMVGLGAGVASCEGLGLGARIGLVSFAPYGPGITAKEM